MVWKGSRSNRNRNGGGGRGRLLWQRMCLPTVFDGRFVEEALAGTGGGGTAPDLDDSGRRLIGRVRIEFHRILTEARQVGQNAGDHKVRVAFERRALELGGRRLVAVAVAAAGVRRRRGRRRRGGIGVAVGSAGRGCFEFEQVTATGHGQQAARRKVHFVVGHCGGRYFDDDDGDDDTGARDHRSTRAHGTTRHDTTRRRRRRNAARRETRTASVAGGHPTTPKRLRLTAAEPLRRAERNTCGRRLEVGHVAPRDRRRRCRRRRRRAALAPP